MLCRTTRHKALNGTFTVVKECIIENAHYATFERKPQKTEIDCDIQLLEGFEVAYCICNTSLCNYPSIGEQFAEFEQKNPELFDDVSVETTELMPDINKNKEEIEENEEEKQLENQTTFNPKIEEIGERSKELFPVNNQKIREEELGKELLSSTTIETIKREEDFINNEWNNEENEKEEIIKQNNLLTTPKISTKLFTKNLIIERPKQQSLEVDNTPLNGDILASGAQLGLLPELQCMQCKEETNNTKINAECHSQIVVSCPDLSKQINGIGRPFCITRHFWIEPGGNLTIEKNCLTERKILEEYGSYKTVDLLNGANRDEAACLDFRPSLSGQQQRLCVCSSPQCNKVSLSEQMSFGIRKIAELDEIENKQKTNKIQTIKTTEKIKETTEIPLEEEIIEALNCAVCVDNELNDANADCRTVRTINCAKQLTNNEKQYCITRQTQNSKGFKLIEKKFSFQNFSKDSFIVEKGCMSKTQFSLLFPDEISEQNIGNELLLGCASTHNGFVNYCICDSQMCNRYGIAQQAETSRRITSSTNLYKTSTKQLFPSTSTPPPPTTTTTTLLPTTTEQIISTKSFFDDYTTKENNNKIIKEEKEEINIKIIPKENINEISKINTTSTEFPLKILKTTTTNNLDERLEKWKINTQKNNKLQSRNIFEEENNGTIKRILMPSILIISFFIIAFMCL
ncbi:unnamed protein product [Meloidogyne enterolobii]|uniref:Uncharacterized protein n=2 Tax=Meloidogyne enterolobii TaxID=390850 RepID=A0ACB0XVP7_MELEN